jgi:hypothetical protein
VKRLPERRGAIPSAASPVGSSDCRPRRAAVTLGASVRPSSSCVPRWQLADLASRAPTFWTARLGAGLPWWTMQPGRRSSGSTAATTVFLLSSTLANGGRETDRVRSSALLPEMMTMPTLPPAILLLVAPFAPLFAPRVWRHAQVLLGGAILAPGRRTVAAALRVMGLEREPRFERYHRVLNRATLRCLRAGSGRAWPRAASCSVCWWQFWCRAGRCCSGSTLRPAQGRLAGAALGREDRGAGDLPRSGAVEQRTLRQGQWAALGLPDAGRPDRLGGPFDASGRLGAAIPDGPGPIRTLQPRPWAAPQSLP